jgi:hypothetical protein
LLELLEGCDFAAGEDEVPASAVADELHDACRWSSRYCTRTRSE